MYAIPLTYDIYLFCGYFRANKFLDAIATNKPYLFSYRLTNLSESPKKRFSSFHFAVQASFTLNRSSTTMKGFSNNE